MLFSNKYKKPKGQKKMKRMIQMLVCCVLATVLVMGSMANAMAQSMVGQPFMLQPQQSQALQLQPGKPFFTAEFFSPMSPTTVELSGGGCRNQVTAVLPGRPTIQQYNCGPVPFVFFTNMGNNPVQVYAR
jgi:hypothetical protein